MDAPVVSVIIPSRQEVFLDQTIRDVLTNAAGPIEVFVILDGYDIPVEERVKDERLIYLHLPPSNIMNKRIGVNTAVKKARGLFVMALDAHCMVGPGFDVILARDCTDNMIMIPRRYKLDPVNWKIQDESPVIDYEYWLWLPYKRDHILKPYMWHERREQRADTMIDDTLTMQGSCWFMRKDYYERMGFMRCEGYTPWGQEDVELVMECWTTGGRVVVNKHTWYAHLFKGKTFGRMYKANQAQHAESRRYAYNYWCVERKADFEAVIKRFMPIPHWRLPL